MFARTPNGAGFRGGKNVINMSHDCPDMNVSVWSQVQFLWKSIKFCGRELDRWCTWSSILCVVECMTVCHPGSSAALLGRPGIWFWMRRWSRVMCGHGGWIGRYMTGLEDLVSLTPSSPPPSPNAHLSSRPMGYELCGSASLANTSLIPIWACSVT